MRRVILVAVLAAICILTAAVPTYAQTPDAYVVQRGDTLSGIAARFGVPVEELARANGLSSHAWVYTGQRVSIPAHWGPGDLVEDWVGTVVKNPPGAQFDDYFQLRSNPGGRYGVAAADDRLAAELARVCVTGQDVRIWGYVRDGVPDVNGKQIVVQRLEVVESSLPPMRDLTPLAEVSASSFYPPDRGGSYEPSAAVDGRVDTPWVEGASGAGRGAWLMLSFKRPVQVTAVTIDPGYDRSSHLFYANNRLKRAVLVFSSGEQVQIDLADRTGMQTISLARAPGGPITTTFVKLVIEDVYQGRLYDDTCVGEIQVWGREG